jgi:hypothetical protein
MSSKIQFGFNVDNLVGKNMEVKIDKAKIDAVLKKLKTNNILYFMGFDIKKSYYCICNGQPKCEICIRGNEYISATSDRKLAWLERVVLKHIVGNIEKKYAQAR